MKNAMIFLVGIFFLTSCYDSDGDSTLGDFIWYAVTHKIVNTNDVDDATQMSLTSDVNLAETTGDAYVQLQVDDEYVFIPFNGENPIQISSDTPILRSDKSENGMKWIHILTYQLEGFVLHDLENIKSSKSFDNILFFKKGNEIREVDFNIQVVK